MDTPQRYKYSRDDYYRITNADCISVALALGMQIDEGKQTTAKATHIKDSGGLYIFPNNNWYRHSDGAKGFPVDLVMDVLGCDRDYALDFIARNVINGVQVQNFPTSSPRPTKQHEDKPVEFKVPPHDIKPDRVYAYLIKSRGIDKDIVGTLIRNKEIAEDSIHHNCLFFGRDENGEIKSCALRGTNTFKQFRGEVAGGDKSCSFAMNGTGPNLRLFESPIDAMSHATFSKLLGKDWTTDSRLSTNGCGYQSVFRYLSNHTGITAVAICYDNDEAGRKAAAETKIKIARDFPDRELKVSIIHPRGKDWNEELQEFRTAEKSGMSVGQYVAQKYSPAPAQNVTSQDNDNENIDDEDEDDEQSM